MCQSKKKTECVEPSGYKTIETKRGPRKMFWCNCASCGIKKYKFVKSDGSTSGRPVKQATTTRKKTGKRRTTKKSN